MKKWSTNWTPINVISHIRHTSLAESSKLLPFSDVDVPVDTKEETMFAEFVQKQKDETEKVVFHGVTEEEKQAAVEAAKQEAYAAGLAEGEKKAQKQNIELEQQLTKAVSSIAPRLTSMLNEWQEYASKTREDSKKLAVGVARKVASEALTEHAEENILALVEKCLEYFVREPSVVVEVNSRVKATLEEKIQADPVLGPYVSKIVLQENAAIPEHDCSITWNSGGASLIIEDRWQHIASILGYDGTEMIAEITKDDSVEAAIE